MLIAIFNLVLWSIVASQSASRIELNADLFSFKLREFADFSLQHNDFQTKFWDGHKNQPKKSKRLFKFRQVAEDIDRRFQNIYTALKRLQDIVRNAYRSQSKEPSFPNCCDKDTQTKFDRRFGATVLLFEPCLFLSSTARNPDLFLTEEFANMARGNLVSLANIRWQYFASPQGYINIYPGSCFPPGFEHFTRPWYKGLVKSTARNVVILMDTSKSMGEPQREETRLEVAKTVVNALLDDLGELDLVALINFANRPETLRVTETGGCFATRLALATDKNKATLKKYVSSLKPKGASYLIPALKRAFTYLSGKNMQSNIVRDALFTNRSASDIIHLVTDGSVNGPFDEVVDAFSGIGANISSKFYFLVYGIGMQNSSYLEELVDENYPMGVETKLVIVNSSSGALEAIQNASEIFSTIAPEEKILRGTPYFDTLQLGEIMTLSATVRDNGEFIGVVAIDITLTELIVEALKYRPNDVSYSFLMDGNGWLITHPQMETYPYDQAAQVFVDTFEPITQDFVDVILDAKRHGSVRKRQVITTKFLAPGDSLRYGVYLDRTYPAIYHVEKIGTVDFYLFNVVRGSIYQYNIPDALPRGSFLFHQLELNAVHKPCSHLNLYASKERSGVYLARRAYRSTEFYLAQEFTEAHISRIAAVVENTRSSDDLINLDARRDLLSSAILDKLWTKVDTEVKDFITWRFFGTESGVFRIFPATEIAPNYDPVQRSWYQTAVAFRTKIVVLPPHRHEESGAPLIGIASTIFQLRDDTGMYDNGSDVFGVMGIEFLLTYIHSVFLNIYPECAKKETFKCFMIDHGGYILLIDEYTDALKFRGSHHIADMEPQVTSVLLQHGVLQRVNCSNVVTGKLQRMYRISENQSVYWGTFGQGYFDFFGFKLLPVTDTNIYLVIRSVTQSICVRDFYCTCPEKDEDCLASWNNRYCECPCSSIDESFESCTNEYIKDGKAFPCVAPTPKLVLFNRAKDLSEFDTCFNISIEMFGEQGYNEVVYALITIAATVPVVVTCWVAYHTEKCIKLLDHLLTRKNLKQQRGIEKLAEDIVAQYSRKKQDRGGASLTRIKSVMKKHYR